jgi:hypothetical protein
VTTTDDLAALPAAALRDLTDRLDLDRLCTQYVLHLDRDHDDDSWLPEVFTPDAVLTFPMGRFRGLAGLVGFQDMVRANFARTHHVSSNHDVRPDGDRARLRAHLVARHVPRAEDPTSHYDLGGHYEAEAVRTPDGWRISRLDFDVVWTTGEPPSRPAGLPDPA